MAPNEVRVGLSPPSGSAQVLGLWVTPVASPALVCKLVWYVRAHECPLLPLTGPSLLGFAQIPASMRRGDKGWEGDWTECSIERILESY